MGAKATPPKPQIPKWPRHVRTKRRTNKTKEKKYPNFPSFFFFYYDQLYCELLSVTKYFSLSLLKKIPLPPKKTVNFFCRKKILNIGVSVLKKKIKTLLKNTSPTFFSFSTARDAPGQEYLLIK